MVGDVGDANHGSRLRMRRTVAQHDADADNSDENGHEHEVADASVFRHACRHT